MITCALGLEIWQIYLLLNEASLPNQLNSLFYLASIALIAHGIEGLIAAFKAKTYDRDFISYGIYTFFVGFVGLLELKASLSNVEQ